MAVEDEGGIETIREKITWRTDVQEKDITRSINSKSNDVDDLNVENPMNTEHGIKVVGESLKPLSFCERMRNLSMYRLPLKKQMRDKTISYVDLFRPDPFPSRRDDEKQSKVCKRSKTQKYS